MRTSVRKVAAFVVLIALAGCASSEAASSSTANELFWDTTVPTLAWDTLADDSYLITPDPQDVRSADGHTWLGLQVADHSPLFQASAKQLKPAKSVFGAARAQAAYELAVRFAIEEYTNSELAIADNSDSRRSFLDRMTAEGFLPSGSSDALSNRLGQCPNPTADYGRCLVVQELDPRGLFSTGSSVAYAPDLPGQPQALSAIRDFAVTATSYDVRNKVFFVDADLTWLTPVELRMGLLQTSRMTVTIEATAALHIGVYLEDGQPRLSLLTNGAASAKSRKPTSMTAYRPADMNALPDVLSPSPAVGPAFGASSTRQCGVDRKKDDCTWWLSMPSSAYTRVTDRATIDAQLSDPDDPPDSYSLWAVRFGTKELKAYDDSVDPRLRDAGHYLVVRCWDSDNRRDLARTDRVLRGWSYWSINHDGVWGVAQATENLYRFGWVYLRFTVPGSYCQIQAPTPRGDAAYWAAVITSNLQTS